MKKQRELKYGDAIREAIDLCMEEYPEVFIIGEGVPDPKGIFGTTLNLVEKYGDCRVLDMPLAENGLTGVCIGAALMGMRPIMTHQRMDFSLLCMDELINSAAKWHYMFNGQSNVPLVVRMVIGRGWGQGPQHSQNLQALFAHIPGLKVVMPTTAYDVKGMLISSVEDNNPVIFIEHRWLYNISGYVPENLYRVPIDKANIINEGNDLTIAATSYMTVESLKTIKILEEHGLDIELIDIRSLRPIDDKTIINSVKKTGKLLVIDSSWKTGGFTAEIIARVAENASITLDVPPQRISLPDIPTPTSKRLTKYYYPNKKDIAKKILQMMGWKKAKIDKLLLEREMKEEIPLDVPDLSFVGPF